MPKSPAKVTCRSLSAQVLCPSHLPKSSAVSIYIVFLYVYSIMIKFTDITNELRVLLLLPFLFFFFIFYFFFFFFSFFLFFSFFFFFLFLYGYFSDIFQFDPLTLSYPDHFFRAYAGGRVGARAGKGVRSGDGVGVGVGADFLYLCWLFSPLTIYFCPIMTIFFIAGDRLRVGVGAGDGVGAGAWNCTFWLYSDHSERT